MFNGAGGKRREIEREQTKEEKKARENSKGMQELPYATQSLILEPGARSQMVLWPAGLLCRSAPAKVRGKGYQNAARNIFMVSRGSSLPVKGKSG